VTLIPRALQRRLAQAGSLGLLAVCAACTEGSGGVTRMVDGVRYEGRFVNPEAYAAYTAGIEQETRSDYGKALTWYLEARAEDPESPEIWARIGSVQCYGTEAARGPAAAARAFDQGVLLDPSYYGNYFERARCEERAQNFDAGLKDATAAVDRRPGDEPANLLVARLLQAQGRTVEARLWLEAFGSYREASPAMNRALEAARAPALATPSARDAIPHSGPARSVAFAELRAGQIEIAREHAQIELGADPTNSDAWIASLVACDALRDAQCFETTLESLKSPSLAPSETALAFLGELLSRRAGAKMTR
jgi:tetratricopeptide (TPR) repeat protein